MSNDYLQFCEDLFSKFLDGVLEKQDVDPKIFQLGYCPEPYLVHGNPQKPLFVLTTNPGNGMDIQKREFVLKDNSGPIKCRDKYENNARRLMEWYLANLPGPPLNRLKKQIFLSEAIGVSGMLQVESIPFHSPTLPNKSRIIRKMKKDSLINTYWSKLKEYLEDKTVIALTAVPTNSSISKKSLNSEWIKFLISTMSYDLESSDRVNISKSISGKISCALFVSRKRKSPKALCCMMGANNWPSREGMEKIASSLG